MTKREFLDIVFALVPNEANAIMDAFDEYVESSEPHWIPVTERLPENDNDVLVQMCDDSMMVDSRTASSNGWFWADLGDEPIAWMPLPEPYKGVTE